MFHLACEAIYFCVMSKSLKLFNPTFPAPRKRRFCRGVTQMGEFDCRANFSSSVKLHPSALRHPFRAPPSRRPTQAPSVGLALRPRLIHPCDLAVTGPRPGPLHPLTPHLLTRCLTLPLTFFFLLLLLSPSMATTHTGLQPPEM